ncbi:helix-turn-helix transcriptional regulator [Streptomyces noursei]|uniref:helix-turn-helix transcriptional regulator n=1 Tax=Streptomyces noursei TaxID=1971 RepID=UPI00344FD0C3
MTEKADNSAHTDKRGLSERALRIYRQILDDEPPTPDDPGLQELLALRAVVPSTHTPGRYVALDPHQAAHTLLWHGVTEVTHIMQRLAEVPGITDRLSVEHDRGQWRNSAGSEYLEDADLVNARIDRAMATASEELLTSQPRRRTETLINMATPRDSALLDRGCSLRTLYPYSARIGIHEPKWMQAMAQKGAAVRTLAIPFPRMIIIDRRHAFVEDLIVDRSPAHSAWYVTDRAVVEWIAMIFDLYWDRADPWSEPMHQVGEVTTAIQRSILRELVAGRDQKQLAARLNLSEKTVHNHLVDLRAKLGLTTTAQVIYWWATSPENSSTGELKSGESAPEFP